MTEPSGSPKNFPKKAKDVTGERSLMTPPLSLIGQAQISLEFTGRTYHLGLMMGYNMTAAWTCWSNT